MARAKKKQVSSEKVQASKKSLDQIYNEKIAKKKQIATTPPKTAPKTIPKVKPITIEKPEPQTQKDDANIVVGNIKIKKNIIDQNLILLKKREKSKALIIAVLSILIAIVVFITGVLVFFNLTKQQNGEMIVNGTGAVWLVEDKEIKEFYLPNELSQGARVNLKIDIKKLTYENLNLVVSINAYKNTDLIENILIVYNTLSETNTEGFEYDPNIKKYFKEGWSAPAGSVINFCTEFWIGNEIDNINVSNFKIVFSLSVSPSLD